MGGRQDFRADALPGRPSWGGVGTSRLTPPPLEDPQGVGRRDSRADAPLGDPLGGGRRDLRADAPPGRPSGCGASGLEGWRPPWETLWGVGPPRQITC